MILKLRYCDMYYLIYLASCYIFDKPLPQIHPNLVKCAFYIYFVDYADNFAYYAGIMLNAFAIICS